MNDNKKILRLSLLRAVALIVTLAGALGSLGLMLHAGRKNNSVLLIALFVIWVLSPFTGLLLVSMKPMRLSPKNSVTLYCLMLFITLGSLVSYSGVLSPPGTKPAFVFLVVPLLSWILMVAVILITGSMSRKLSRKRDSG